MFEVSSDDLMYAMRQKKPQVAVRAEFEPVTAE
jgi:hypothetical protein